MSTDRLWELLGKKLSGESSPSELQEFEDLLRSHPELHYSMQTIADMWNQSASTREDTQEAFQRHLSRMKLKMTDPDAFDDTTDAGESRVRFMDWLTNKTSATVPRGHPYSYREEKSKQRVSLEGILVPPGSGQKLKTALLVLSTLFCAFLVAASFYAYRHSAVSQTASTVGKHEFYTKPGTKKKILLPDGTRVWLNSGSSMTYAATFGEHLREVALSGEAYFDVTRNVKKPFIIHTQNIAIKVLGTAFNVKSYPGERNTETSLIHGSVEVTMNDRPSEKIIIHPKEKLVIANAVAGELPQSKKVMAVNARKDENLVAIRHLTYAQNDSSVLETSWVDNKLVFRSETFGELAVKMERWYGVSIEFDDEAISKIRFTGIFESESVEQALAALQVSSPFVYQVNDKHIKISK